ncbi:MAG: DUF2807 domain-containing protein [Bacteroidales bacterium]|nr:DUF2807 domain-containing protein [Bacteroidales bacterium]
MKTTVTALMACLLMLAGIDANAQRKKKSATNPDTKVLTLGGTYTRLEVSSAFEVIVSDTVKQPVATLPAHLHNNIEFEVENGKLSIRLKGRNSMKQRPRIVLPYNPQLTEVELSGASSFRTPMGLNGDIVKLDIDDASTFEGNITAAKKADIELAGASYFHGRVESGMVEYESKGASTALITGSAYIHLDLDMSQASKLDAKNLVARKVKGALTDASNALVQCTESLRVNITGASTLTYSGTPRDIDCPTDVLSRLRRK